VHFYAQRVRLLLAVLNGVGEMILANSIFELALTSIEAASVRGAVDAALSQDSDA
jgi:hypothetical protein